MKWSPTLTEELILKQDTFFNVIFRPFLGQGRYSSKEAAAMYEERMAAGENVDPNNVFPEGHITIKSPPQATVVEDDDTYEYDDDDYEYAIDDINAANAYDDW